MYSLMPQNTIKTIYKQGKHAFGWAVDAQRKVMVKVNFKSFSKFQVLYRLVNYKIIGHVRHDKSY